MDETTRTRWMAARLKHGGYSGGKEIAEHYIWRSMVARCTNPNTKDYSSYGGRGIKVCPRWSDYLSFVCDMGNRPTPEHTLDRINTFGDYTPENCRWATPSEQQKNKRTTRRYTNGEFTGTPAECAAYLGISRSLAAFRMRAWGTYERGVQWVVQHQSQI